MVLKDNKVGFPKIYLNSYLYTNLESSSIYLSPYSYLFYNLYLNYILTYIYISSPSPLFPYSIFFIILFLKPLFNTIVSSNFLTIR